MITDKELKDISNTALIRNAQNPDLNEIKEQALTCSAELLKLVALIGRYAREDEP